MSIDQIDVKTVTMEQLEGLTLEQLLANNIGEYNLSSNLSDGVYFGYIEAYEAKRREADVANSKKGGLNVSITINVVKAHTLADPLEDKDALVGRKHFESYNVFTEYGQAQLVKLILGVLGIGFKDKEAMATLGRNPLSLLEELQTNKVAFGFTIKNSVSAAGYENCNIVLKSAAFINMERAFEMLS